MSEETRPHLVHEAYVSLLKRAEEFDEKDWDAASRFERHAINAALDLKAAREEIARLKAQLEEKSE